MKHLCLIVTVLLFAACGGESKKTTDQQDTATAEPTYWDSIQQYNPQTMTLVLDGKELELVYFKEHEDLVYKALEISSQLYPNKYSIKSFLDFTGDGVNDTATYTINRLSDTAILETVTIQWHGKIIWTDSLLLKTDEFKNLKDDRWKNDSAYYKLYPYSLIATLIPADTQLTEYQYPNATELVMKNVDMRQSNYSYYVETKFGDLSSADKGKKVEEIDVYFLRFKGRYIADLSFVGGAVHGWYAPDSAFITVYAP